MECCDIESLPQQPAQLSVKGFACTHTNCMKEVGLTISSERWSCVPCHRGSNRERAVPKLDFWQTSTALRLFSRTRRCASHKTMTGMPSSSESTGIAKPDSMALHHVCGPWCGAVRPCLLKHVTRREPYALIHTDSEPARARFWELSRSCWHGVALCCGRKQVSQS